MRAIIRDASQRAMTTPRIVKWLLNNRHNGYYWRSARVTPRCALHAMSDFVRANQARASPTSRSRFDLDNGKTVKTDQDQQVRTSSPTTIASSSKAVRVGWRQAHVEDHQGRVKGALYFNTYLRYFTKEDHITAAGHELKVDRKYFKLAQIPFEVEVDGAEGQQISEQRLRYERVELNNGDRVNSGDLIQVEFKVTSDNDYTFLAFEDMKPAGCEPVDLTSGSKGQEGFYSYMELRDEKVTFFVPSLGRGDHLMRYRMRAEVPGVFHALPTTLFGMYVPELRANSHEHVIEIVD